ncbi:PREDICTED: AAA-ATPase ASD, mitochondrial-like [Ipomoea nil]|uniref:AAA-ATPase ASD, mitochondrial-like n=1 Tax=Ipomoea nil TaxID=35883 RepID=UPI000901E301|nr:PREDICTED: AAA-ATPase ASD, mitochondrial-like [Ipomoea nil]
MKEKKEKRVMADLWSNVGPALATFMFFRSVYESYFPQDLISRYINKVLSYFYPYVTITFPEFKTEGFYERSKVFGYIERYLSSSASTQATSLLANGVRGSTEYVVLSMGHYEKVIDIYKGIRLEWSSYKHSPSKQTINWGGKEVDKRLFDLKFHKKHLEVVTKHYLKHVVEEGKRIYKKEKKRRLYTNNKSDDWDDDKWSYVTWKHPSTFETMALAPKMKQEIIDDLIAFRNAKDYYMKIGKAWKHGYLLYGPPGTGKSSTIAAMANLMEYDVYDIELTTVKDNSDLRKLLIDTTSKSIIVIEDIDCSLDLTGKRSAEEEESSSDDEDDIPIPNKAKKKEKKSEEVTLSGLLNFVDGLWSAIGEERIMIFTTNHVEKLDLALIRRGRMDMHIELSYCCFEAFKVLARNYLQLESHLLFSKIECLLAETKITPAHVGENLMPKSAKDNAEVCLQRLIETLETAKEEARLKTMEQHKPRAAERNEKTMIKKIRRQLNRLFKK